MNPTSAPLLLASASRRGLICALVASAWAAGCDGDSVPVDDSGIATRDSGARDSGASGADSGPPGDLGARDDAGFPGQTVDFGDVPRAFPSAMGEGAGEVTGGRGGVKFFITSVGAGNVAELHEATDSTEAHYTGTLGGALQLEEPAHIIPRVSGNIDGADLRVRNRSGGTTFAKGHKTIHGHLAPEGGLAVINTGLYFEWTDDLIIRHLTVRYGRGAELGREDTVFFTRSPNIIVDHCSIGWGGDEALSVEPGGEAHHIGNVILQRNLFGQQRDGHNVGVLFGTPNSPASLSVNVHLNFFAASNHRFPGIGGNESSFARFANNVVFDWFGRAVILAEALRLDVIGYYFRRLPNDEIPLGYPMLNQYIERGDAPPSIHAAGSIVEALVSDPNADNRPMFTYFPHTDTTPLPDSYFRSEPLPHDPDTGYVPVSATDALRSVIGQREVGHNRATAADGRSIVAHDAVDAAYLDAFEGRHRSRVPEAEWEHPERAPGVFFTDDNWNGIYDPFEAQNGIRSSEDVLEEYTWDGVTYLNGAGYDSFEVWSFIAAGEGSLLSP